ncbi:MAG: anti-sigma factor [Hyphomicrobiales bacterium]|nr:anti-sigma factor [Hyphomicrobiales bacterium]
MIFEDDQGPMDGSDDLIAAEYVVGALSAEERRQAALRIDRDPGFARLVEAWEARLSPLADDYPEVEPPAAAKQVIDRMLFAEGGAVMPGGAPAGLWQSLAFWRGLAAAALALLVVAVAAPLLAPRSISPEGGTQFVASIAPKDSDVGYLAYYDPAVRSLSLAHVSGEREQGHAFELWAIEGQAKPVSLGVIPAGKTIRVRISPEIGKLLANGGTLAISLEAPGGSTTGQPTGPVVAVGGLNQI